MEIWGWLFDLGEGGGSTAVEPFRLVLTDSLLKATTDLMHERFFAFSTYAIVMETSIAQPAKQQAGSNNVLLSSVPRPSLA